MLLQFVIYFASSIGRAETVPYSYSFELPSVIEEPRPYESPSLPSPYSPSIDAGSKRVIYDRSSGSVWGTAEKVRPQQWEFRKSDGSVNFTTQHHGDPNSFIVREKGGGYMGSGESRAKNTGAGDSIDVYLGNKMELLQLDSVEN